MHLSQCIFNTGDITMTLEDSAYARDLLDELFTHSDGVSERFFKELEAAGLQLPQPPIRVILVTPAMGREPFSIHHAEEFAARMMESMPKYIQTPGLFFYINSRIQGIVSDATDEETKALYQGLVKLVETNRRGKRAHVAMSNRYDSLFDISRGCDENQEGHQFARFLEIPVEVLVQPRDFYLQGGDLPCGDDEEVFGHLAQRIRNAMIAGERDRIHRVLDEALHYMVGKFPRVSGVHMRALRFCHALELTLVGADLVDRLFIQNFRLLEDVIEAENEAALGQTFHRKIDELCDYSQKRTELHQGERMKQVMDYIRKNMTEPALSITMLAEAFHMSEENLSSVFRSYFQETIPNVIHRQRVDYIKTQLLSTRKSVRDICADAGYISIATMNRAFLRLEGMYPGQYRQEYKKRNQL